MDLLDQRAGRRSSRSRWSLRRIPESTGPARRLDLGGAALSTLAVLGIVWGVVRGAAAGWGSAEVVGSFTLGGLLLLASWPGRAGRRSRWCRCAFFRSRAFSAGNAAGFLLTAALFGAVFFLAQFMQVAFGSARCCAGLRLLPWTADPVPGRAGRRPAGRTASANGRWSWPGWRCRPPACSGSAGSTPARSDYADLVAPLVVAGCGVSMAMPATQSASIGALPPGAVGMASGVYSMMRAARRGGRRGDPGRGVRRRRAATPSFAGGFSRALAVCGVLSLLGAVAGSASPPRRTGPTSAGRRRGAGRELR